MKLAFRRETGETRVVTVRQIRLGQDRTTIRAYPAISDLQIQVSGKAFRTATVTDFPRLALNLEPERGPPRAGELTAASAYTVRS